MRKLPIIYNRNRYNEAILLWMAQNWSNVLVVRCWISNPGSWFKTTEWPQGHISLASFWDWSSEYQKTLRNVVVKSKLSLPSGSAALEKSNHNKKEPDSFFWPWGSQVIEWDIGFFFISQKKTSSGMSLQEFGFLNLIDNS